MDPRKIVSRNRNWWNLKKSDRHEYELVGASEVLERSRFEDNRPIVGFFLHFPNLSVLQYISTDTKNENICREAYDKICNSCDPRLDRRLFLSDLFRDRHDSRVSI